LSLDDTVLSFFPEDAPAEPSENLKAMRVRDLLAMSTGHHADAIEPFPYTDPAVSQTRAFLSLPVAHKPGTHFVYNTPASYMLSAIVQKVSGTPLVDYLRPRLFEPLGIRNPKWDATPKGVSLGGFGLSVTTEDSARFGQLYLQKGEWEGKRLLPTEWVAAATSRQASNGNNPASDWDQGYGYQFLALPPRPLPWRRGLRPVLHRDAGAGRGRRDHERRARHAGRPEPGVGAPPAWDEGGRTPPADAPTQDRLMKKLASLSLPPQAGKATSPNARRVSGRAYELPKNDDGIEAVAVELGQEPTLGVRSNGQEYRVPFGIGSWRYGGRLPMGRSRLQDDAASAVAATGAWTDDDTLALKACFHETPFCATLSLRFAGDALVLDREMNVGFGPTKRPTLVGLPRRTAASARPKS
jgi:hypothetical protein